MAAEPLDCFTFPPTQALVMEVLASRARLGESCWTFPATCRKALDALDQRGLIGWKHASVESACLAWLTDAGRAAALSENYAPPAPPDLTAVPWRQGRRKGRNLYAVTGPDWEAHPEIGCLDSPELAREAAEAHNAALAQREASER